MKARGNPGVMQAPRRAAAVVLAALVTLVASREAGASAPLDVFVVMDNSDAMIQSDGDFRSLAAVNLLVDLLRDEDRMFLVSSGASASVVLTAAGNEKEKFVTAIGMMKRESSANDVVDVLRTLDAKAAEIGKNAVKGGPQRKTIVAWFMSSEIRLNVKHPGYITTDRARALLWKVKQQGLGKSPFKKSAVRDLHKEIFDVALRQAADLADGLGEKGVELNVFVLGKTLGAPGLLGDGPLAAMEDIAKRTKGRLVLLGGVEDGLALDSIVSMFVEKISAPTATFSNEEVNMKGDQFEVYRKCRNLWVVVLFKVNPPKKIFLTSTDETGDKVNRWPFGKRPEDVLFKKPELEKGALFKTRRWYKPPSNPSGYGLFAIADPREGIYRIKAEFERGEAVILRVFQDIDLEFGFLTQPPASIPMGKAFSAVAGLKGPDGNSFSFHRSFLNDLEFRVEMEKEGGSVPAWGESKVARFSKEGEVMMSFEPASAGIYYVKGEVTHGRGEFEAALTPFKVEVYHRVKIEFVDEELSWSGPAKEGWFTVSPGLRLAPGVSIPGDLVFEVTTNWSKITNRSLFEVQPPKGLAIVAGKSTYPLKVRYKDPGALRIEGETFNGPLYLTIKDSQKRNVEGTGTWTIKVRGKATPWPLRMYLSEYSLWVNLLLGMLVVLMLGLERRVRPSFGKNVKLNITKKFGMPAGVVSTFSLGTLHKPLLPFRRQRVVIGTDGSVNNRHANRACRIIGDGKQFLIRPLKLPVRFRQADASFTAHTTFFGKLDERYLIGEYENEVEFWFSNA
jgi:hypothetical protein